MIKVIIIVFKFSFAGNDVDPGLGGQSSLTARGPVCCSGWVADLPRKVWRGQSQTIKKLQNYRDYQTISSDILKMKLLYV